MGRVYRAEEWIGEHWEPLSISSDDMEHQVWVANSVQKISGNSVRVVDPSTGETFYYNKPGAVS